MPKPNLQQVLSVADPMLSDNFQLEISNIPGGGSDRALLLQCKSAVKPGMTLSEVEVAVFGHVLKHAGRLEYSHEMSVEYYETWSGEITRILERWLEWGRSHTTQHGHFKNPSDGSGYARDCYLTIFNQVGDVSLRYKLINMWPSSVPDISFDGSSVSNISLSATFKYDAYEIVTSTVG